MNGHVCHIGSLVSSRSRITIKPCLALPTRTSRRLPRTKSAILQPQIQFSKLILAAVGLSFAIASPVPQDNNDALESCNTGCTNSYTICTDGETITAEDEGWYVTQ